MKLAMHVLIALFIAIVLMKSRINRMIHGDDGWGACMLRRD
jgi:hypothetical protein